MSALLPISEKQAELWSRPRPEPVSLELPGWATEVTEPDATFPNQRWVRFRQGDSTVELFRYWDQPRSPGGPMAVASRQDVVVAGKPATLMTTSMFQGVAREVRLLWITGKGHDVGYGVRLSFQGCSDEVVADALARIVVSW